MHRTEVVRYPSGHGNDDPIFPLRAKYFYSNFSVEGLEKRKDDEMKDWDPDMEVYSKLVPPITEEEAAKPSELITDENIRYKFGTDGRRLQTDESGRAIRRTANWRPQEIPDWYWKDLSEEEKAVY